MYRCSAAKQVSPVTAVLFGGDVVARWWCCLVMLFGAVAAADADAVAIAVVGDVWC